MLKIPHNAKPQNVICHFMTKHLTHIDEETLTFNELQSLEEIVGVELPIEYRNFILEHNGFTIQPNVPKIQAESNYMTFGIDRFLSIGDLLLQKTTKVCYTNEEYIKEYDEGKYAIDINKLLTIAIAERGCYHIYLGKEEFGQVYFSNYSGGDGLVRFETKSFYEFIDTLGFYDSECEQQFEPKILGKSTKVFDSYLFDTPENPSLGFDRFKAVLKFYGDPNFSIGGKNVVQTYFYKKDFLYYIIEQGGIVDGLLNFASNFDEIQFLVYEFHLDINKPYQGRFPLQIYTGSTDYVGRYELMHKFLQSKIYLDLSIVDEDGNDIVSRLKKIVVGYNDYIEYTKKKGYYEKMNFIQSEVINEIIKDKPARQNWFRDLFSKNKNGR